MSVIKTSLQLLFSKSDVDVSEDLAPDLLSFSYEDKEDNEADEIRISLKDPDGKWASTWQPDAAEQVTATIIKGTVQSMTESVISMAAGAEAAEKRLYCGKFYIDNQRASGAPRTVELRGVSIPLNTPIRKKMKSKSWEKITLKAIAQAIAADNGIGLYWDAEYDPSFDRRDQKRESDLMFLSRLCKDAGFSIKVTDLKIVIFDQSSYEKKEATKTITLGESELLSWNFEANHSESYKAVTVSYYDPKKKKKGTAASNKLSSTSTAAVGKNAAVNEYTYVDPDADESAQEYSVKKRATSIDEARTLAKAKLRELNKRKITGNITMVGDPDLAAGGVIALSGFGSFDGNFIIEHASHSMSSSGYTTACSLRRVNSNY